MGETPAELPFAGDQVGLFRAQPGRPFGSYRRVLKNLLYYGSDGEDRRLSRISTCTQARESRRRGRAGVVRQVLRANRAIGLLISGRNADRSGRPVHRHPDPLGPAPGRRYAHAMVVASVSPSMSAKKLVFSVPPHRPTVNFPASWNVAPTGPLPVVRYDRRAGERSLDLMRWGLVPYWAKDIKVGFASTNAKAERIEGTGKTNDHV